MSTTSVPSTSGVDPRFLLSEFDSSGQSAASFARSKGIAAWRLYHALQKRSEKARSACASARATPSVLVPVRVADAKPVQPAAALELHVAGGHRVVIGADFDAPTLRRLLEALASC